MKALQALGMVDVQVGDGMFVGGGGLGLLAQPLSWRLLLGQGGTNEVIEARVLVETELAGLAAERATPEDLEIIGQRLDVLQTSWQEAERYARADVAFHLAIAAAAHNRVLYHVLEVLADAVRVWIVENFEVRPPGETPEANSHVQIFQAIRARDGQWARHTMAAHLHSAGRRLLASLAAAQSPTGALLNPEGR